MMRKFQITLLMLTSSIVASAQMTPEAWIGMYPSLPSITDLIAYDKDIRNPDGSDDNELISDFLKSVDTIGEQASEMMGKTAKAEFSVQNKARRKEKVAGTHVTVGQFEDMSDAQQEKIARQSAMNQLKGMGLSQADIDKMKKGNLSKADQQALANKMMKQATGGMSIDDLKFMEQLTDEERATFMQQSGLAESMTAKMKSNKKGRLSQDLITRIMKLQGQLTDQSQRCTRMLLLTDVRNFGDSLWQHKYADRNHQLLEERMAINERMDGKQWDKTHTKGQTSDEVKELETLLKKNTTEIFKLQNEFYTEYIPLYHRTLGGILDYIRGTYMSTYRSWKNVNDEAYKITGESRYMVSNSQIMIPASLYGDALKLIEDYNLNTKQEEFHTSTE